LKIVKNEDLCTPTYWDSDEDIEEDKLQKGKHIDVAETNPVRWAKGYIKERIGDLLYIQVRSWDNTEYHMLKEITGEDIAPLGHYTSKSYP
jgi:hypothetical protein